MHCSDEAITAARQRMRDVERHVVTHGIRDVAKFDRHVVELVASHFDGGPPQEPFRSELID